MENNIEFEICKRETIKKAPPIFKHLTFACIALAVTALIFAFVYATIDHDWNHFFNFRCAYVYLIIVSALFAISAVILFYFKTNSGSSTALVLTNKRLYFSHSKNLLFKRKFEVIENYSLNKIVSYEFTKLSNKKRYISNLLLKTPASHASFSIDENFYNEFVIAVNNAS